MLWQNINGTNTLSYTFRVEKGKAVKHQLIDGSFGARNIRDGEKVNI